MSKSRDRHLAKLAARRQAERDAQRRRRQRALGTVATSAAVVLVVVAGLVLFTGGDDTASPSPTVSPSGSPSESPSESPGSPTPQAKPGTQTGTVDPQPAPAEVACGAEAPKAAGKPKPQFSGPPPMKIDPQKTYIATMVTSCGTIEIELDPKTAPQTVNSFVFLANHGYFDGQYIHRIDTSIDVLQGGDPTGTGSGGPGYVIPTSSKEANSTGRVSSRWRTRAPTPGAASSSSSRATTVTIWTPTRTTRSSGTSPDCDHCRP